MTMVPDKSLLLLSDDKSTIFNSTKAISWSCDNKVVLCCAEKLVIVSVIINPYLNSRTEPFMARVEETLNLSGLEQFSIASGLLNFQASVCNLNEGDKQRLSLDPSLTEDSVYQNSIASTFKHAVCSPSCQGLYKHQNLIAAVTYNHRVLIFVEKTIGWGITMDCSPAIKEHTISNVQLPITLGNTMELNQYIDLVHSMCTLELEWSTVISLNEDSDQSFLLLFTGTRGGATNVWKTSLPFETNEDFTFQYTDTYASEVTALSWLSRRKDEGLLAVGYLNGSLRIMSVSIIWDVSTSCVEVKEIFADLSDEGLAMSDLAWAQVDKNITALVGCKNYFLSLYSLSNNDTVKLIHHYHVDVGLPLTSISTFGVRGVASSHDGVLINFQCIHESGNINLNWSSVAITSMPYRSDIPWMCLGVALSPYAGICFSVHRISHRCIIAEIKQKFMHRQMIALSILHELSLESVKQVLGPESQPFSPQDLMIHLRLHIQHITQTNGSLQDILQIYSELNKRDDIRSTQVARDIVLYLKHCSVSRIEYQKELEWVNSAYDNISEKLVIQHIGSCLQEVRSDPTSNELSIIKAMLDWMSARKDTSPHVDPKMYLAWLGRVNKESPGLLCAICGSAQNKWFPADQVCSGSSSKSGHLLRTASRRPPELCALTLLPCQDMSGRLCESCTHPTVNMSALTGVKIIKMKWQCVLCGGCLRDSVS